jgi:chemotaxis protein MotB
MQIVKISLLLVICICVVLLTGCADMDDLRVQNATQRKRIAQLDSRMQASKLKMDQLQRQLDTADSRCQVDVESLQQKVAALEEDRGKKKALIASMQKQLLYGGASIPVELSTILEDFAKGSEMITYDADSGVVKFKSDLLFEKGSDVVAADARNAIKSLCGILNSAQAKNFDILITGHTDDMKIARPQTREKHPTNWHLSAHRAISVLNIMTRNNISSQRVSVRGFGEYRPLEPNKPNKKGNPLNRRVEIYIVPKGF